MLSSPRILERIEAQVNIIIIIIAGTCPGVICFLYINFYNVTAQEKYWQSSVVKWLNQRNIIKATGGEYLWPVSLVAWLIQPLASAYAPGVSYRSFYG